MSEIIARLCHEGGGEARPQDEVLDIHTSVRGAFRATERPKAHAAENSSLHIDMSIPDVFHVFVHVHDVICNRKCRAHMCAPLHPPRGHLLR